MSLFRTVVLSLPLTVSLVAGAVSAQEPAPATQNPQEQRLIRAARDYAAIAGGARFCKLDPDDIEEFIGKSYARIVLLARDDYQKILGRLEFKNILAATSAKEPAEGCKKFREQFNLVLRENR